MLNMKKILVTGTVLTAFCTSAFAASADSQPQSSMSERVNAILHENDADRPCPPPAHRMHRQGPKLTPEQRAEHQKLRLHDQRFWPVCAFFQTDSVIHQYRRTSFSEGRIFLLPTLAVKLPCNTCSRQKYDNQRQEY